MTDKRAELGVGFLTGLCQISVDNGDNSSTPGLQSVSFLGRSQRSRPLLPGKLVRRIMYRHCSSLTNNVDIE
jgi:hypothetical protein